MPCVVETGSWTGPVGNTGNVTKTGITAYNATITGNLINSGTVTGGIAIDSSTINGQISDTGTLSGGIFIDSASLIATNGANAAVPVTGPIFSGGIANYCTIASASNSPHCCRRHSHSRTYATDHCVFRRRHHQFGLH